MLSQAMQDALNAQINLEFSSAYAYLAAGAHFDSANLPGFAQWMRRQYEEELTHALRLLDYLLDRDGRVKLGAVAEPKGQFDKPVDGFEMALGHERKVTAAINKLYALAKSEDDYATQVMLEWFINEQVEEEKSVSQVVDWLKMSADSPAAILMLDQKLGQRAPAAEEAAAE